MKELEMLKFKDSPIGKIAKSKVFELTTIGVIVLNALEIGIDADYSARFYTPANLYKGDLYFIVVENFFATYFTWEISIRFFGYKSKRSCIEAWFIFDSVLVTMMVWETWVMPWIGSSGMGQLSILRLLRLLRITRMVKLMRAFPQLLMIVHGIAAATKAVMWTAMLLVAITFTFAIVFTNEYHQGYLSDEDIDALDDDNPQKAIFFFFGNMGKSMLSLLIMGTILDDITQATNAIRATQNFAMLAAFLFYVILNSFTMLNMLVGILVEVMGSTADSEKESLNRSIAEELIEEIFKQIDADHSGRVTSEEFKMMSKEAHVMKSLAGLGIKERQFGMYHQLLFQKQDSGEAPSLSYQQFLDAISRMRPGSAINALDFVTFKESVLASQMSLQENLVSMEDCCLTSKGIDKLTEHARLTRIKAHRPNARINMLTMENLDRLTSSDILIELQKRLGLANVDELPSWLMDDDPRQHFLQSQTSSWQNEHTAEIAAAA